MPRKHSAPKRKARASSPGEEEELLQAAMDEDVHPSACEGEAIDARQSESVGAEGMECGQKEPASAARQPPNRRGRSRRDAEGTHADKAAGAGKTESARGMNPGRRQRAIKASQGSRVGRPKAHGSAASNTQDSLTQSTRPQLNEKTMPVVEVRKSTRKRKAV